MSIKKVLMISYLFPPLDCGVGRQIKFAKYLPLFGWMPTVLTVNRSILRPKYDPSRIKEVPPSVEIFRTHSIEIRPVQQWLPAVLNRLLGLNPKWFQPVDTLIGWLPFAVRRGLEILKEGNIDLIFSTSMPNTCHLVALILKNKFRIPWVADFRDPWTQNPYITYPRPILKIEEKMERRVIENADRIITTGDFTTKSFIQKYPDQPKEKFSTLPHGFDSDDFKEAKEDYPKFTIAHAGSIYGFRKQTTEIFLDAISELLSRSPNLREELAVKFFGSYLDIVRKSANSRNLEGVVTLLKPASHAEAVKRMMASHVLLLITGIDGHVPMPGKVGEYIATGKPILALVTDGTYTAKVIESTGTGVVVNPSDLKGMAKVVRHFFRLYKEGDLRTKANVEELKKYDVQMLTRRLSEIFDDVIKAWLDKEIIHKLGEKTKGNPYGCRRLQPN